MSNSNIFSLIVVVIAVSAVQCSPRTYPVRLSSSGPSTTTIPVVNKHHRTSTIERLPLRTAGCIPRPKTIDHVCTCYKTIVKPQVNNHIISVPSIQRIIQTSAAPVIEKIHYEATPIEPPSIFPAAVTGFNSFAGISLSRVPSVVPVPSCMLSPKTIVF